MPRRSPPRDGGSPLIERFDVLAARIRSLGSATGPCLVAVDGPASAGKTTFASRLATSLSGSPVIPTDDFASWDDLAGWWPRLEEQVLDPLFAGRSVTYQQRDWIGDPLGDRLGPWRRVPASVFVVLEGVTSARREIADRLAYAVWLDAPREIRLRRGLARDGEHLRSQWLSWMDREERFFSEDGARDRVQLRVNGDPSAVNLQDGYELGRDLA